MSGQLADKVALITGAGRGIGRACALGYAREGARLVLVARTATEIEAVAREARVLGTDALPIVADVAEAQAVFGAVARAVEHFGRIDVLVNNAGAQGPGAPVWAVEPEAWRQTVDVNLWGTFLLCRAVLPAMVAAGHGKVINVASGAGCATMPFFSGYAASKAAVIHFTRTIAEELRPHGINANAIGVRGLTRMWDEVLQAGPGGGSTTAGIQAEVAAGLHPVPEENVPVFVFLAGAASDRVTGQYFEANSLPACAVSCGGTDERSAEASQHAPTAPTGET